MTPDQVAGALSGAPAGNGNALNLAVLANGKKLNYTFAQFYGNLGGRFGRDLSKARDNQSAKKQLMMPAQPLGLQTSGMSLDREAEKNLMAFQRPWLAGERKHAQSCLNSLTHTLRGLIPTTSMEGSIRGVSDAKLSIPLP